MKKTGIVDRKFMALAVSLAKKGAGKTNPNPAVGAVLVKDGKIIASDYHKKAGYPHAEALVIKKAGAKAAGATLYCTLEACVNYGKTPPCADAVIKSGIIRAVFAMEDPNPVNRGKGIVKLRKAGVKTECGLMRDEAEDINRPFVKIMRKRLPYVTIKLAESLDGKIADTKGASKWITSAESRRFVHGLRARNDAVMIGVNTLIKDNPLLTDRYSRRASKQPLRIILDTELRTPLSSRILRTGKSRGKVLIAGGEGALPGRKSALEKQGAKVVLFPEKDGRIRLMALLKYLKIAGVMSVLCEGGGELVSSLIRERLVDEVYFFISPKIIGGRMSPTSCGGPAVDIRDAAKIRNVKIKTIGPDILIRGDLGGFCRKGA